MATQTDPITVTGFGTAAGGGAPRLTLVIDGATVGLGSFGSQSQSLSLTAALTPDLPHDVPVI